MTVTGEPTSPLPSTSGGPARRPGRRRDAAAAREVCPFLASEDGTWRSAYAAREHRCLAVRPPAQPAVAKQRELCLVSAHATCATYRAALAVEDERRTLAPGDDGAALWATVPPAPVVLEPARRMGALPAATARGGGQALLVGLMVVAFLVLVIARTQTPAGVAGGLESAAPASAAASPATLASPTPTASPVPTASPTPEPSTAATATPQPTPAPTPAPTAAATRTYKVKSGDTLSAIAARFDTTVKKLVTLNEIKDPRALRVGQVLQIP